MTSQHYEQNLAIILHLTYSVSSLVPPTSGIEGVVLTLNSIYAEFNIRFFYRQGKLLNLQQEIDCRGNS